MRDGSEKFEIKDGVLETYFGNETSVVIPEGVFNTCSSLESVRIPEAMTEVSDDAFMDCTSLESVYLPEGMKMICVDAFSGCRSLTQIHFGGSREQWKAVKKVTNWNKGVPAKSVICTDGEVPIGGVKL